MMASEWQQCAFQDLFLEPLRNGLTRPKSVRGCGIKMVNMGEIFACNRLSMQHMDRVPISDRERENYLLMRGDLLFARQSLVLAGAGKCVLVTDTPEDTTYESHIIRARLNTRLADPNYYYYYFRSSLGRSNIESIVEQVAAAGIRGSDLALLNVPKPPLEIQHAIATILSTLDDKIELNRQMNETLEAMAQAIFKSWFVDFDPIRTKAAGKKPTGLAPHIADLFPDSFVDSELGEIPKGWRVCPLYDIATFINGAAFRDFHFTEEPGALPVVKIAEIKNGISLQTKFTNTLLDNKYRLNNGDILFAWSGSPDTSIDTFVWTCGPAWLNQHIFRVELHQKGDRSFVYYQLKLMRSIFVEIARNKQTTGLGHVTVQDMKALQVVKCSPEILIAFNQKADPIHDKWYENQLQNQTLTALRDALLPKLISGELQIKDAEKILEGATI